MAGGGRTSRFGFGFWVNIFPRAGFVAFAGAGGGAAAGVGGRGAVTVEAFAGATGILAVGGRTSSTGAGQPPASSASSVKVSPRAAAPSGSQWSLPAFASAWGPHGTLERQIRKTGFA